MLAGGWGVVAAKGAGLFRKDSLFCSELDRVDGGTHVRTDENATELHTRNR